MTREQALKLIAGAGAAALLAFGPAYAEEDISGGTHLWTEAVTAMSESDEFGSTHLATAESYSADEGLAGRPAEAMEASSESSEDSSPALSPSEQQEF